MQTLVRDTRISGRKLLKYLLSTDSSYYVLEVLRGVLGGRVLIARRAPAPTGKYAHRTASTLVRSSSNRNQSGLPIFCLAQRRKAPANVRPVRRHRDEQAGDRSPKPISTRISDFAGISSSENLPGIIGSARIYTPRRAERRKGAAGALAVDRKHNSRGKCSLAAVPPMHPGLSHRGTSPNET